MQSINKELEKIKRLAQHPWFDTLMWFVIVFFVGVLCFSLGMMYERSLLKNRFPVEISYSQEAVRLWNEYQETKSTYQTYFASRNGSVVYPVGCARGNTIKEENKVFFTNLQQALNQGYREAAGC